MYKDKLYVLVGKPDRNFHVQEHELSGELIRCHASNINYMLVNKLKIIDKKVVIPDHYNEQLVVYFLSGSLITFNVI